MGRRVLSGWLALLSCVGYYCSTAAVDGEATRLLVDLDDFADVRGLSIVAERPRKTGSMAVVPDQPWEQGYIAFYSSVIQVGPKDFRIYYHTNGLAGEHSHVAVSTTAIGPWRKPQLGLVSWNNGTKQNNIIYHGRLVAVFMDTAPGVPPTARFKAAVGDALTGTAILSSADGFRWPSGAEGMPNVGWKAMSDTQPVVFYDAPTQRYLGYGRYDVPDFPPVVPPLPTCMSTPFAGSAPGAGSHRFRLIGVAAAPDLEPGCFNRTERPRRAIGFPPPPVSSCVDLYTSNVVRYEDHLLGFPSAYYHFRHEDPPVAVRAGSSSGLGNDGVLEVWMISSRDGLNFSYLAGSTSPAFVPRGVGRFSTSHWRFAGQFDAGIALMTRGWLANSAVSATEEWDTVVMYQRGSQLTHWTEWHSAARTAMIENASRSLGQPLLSGIERLELRRDGWACLRVPGTSLSKQSGTAVTVPVQIPDCPGGPSHLLLNADVPVGEVLRVTALDATGLHSLSEGFITGNGVRLAVQPSSSTKQEFLHDVTGKVAFRFVLEQGTRLYAWELRCGQ